MSRLLFSVALLSLSLARGAGAACPADSLDCGSGAGFPISSHEPAFDCQGTWSSAEPCFHACYDLRAGELGVQGVASPLSWLREVLTTDEYRLVGPGSLPATFSARLHVTGPMGLDAIGWAGIGEGETLSLVVGLNGSLQPLDESIDMPLYHAPGETFVLRLNLGGVSLGSPVDIRARLVFDQLPAGWSVESCQGYGTTVAAQVATWGQLKARYR